jgi:hypothetical protein
VFEDRDWIDGESQALLDRIVGHLPSAPTRPLVNYHPEYRSRSAPRAWHKYLAQAQSVTGAVSDACTTAEEALSRMEHGRRRAEVALVELG